MLLHILNVQTNQIIDNLYGENEPLRRILITHSKAVAEKALSLSADCNRDFVETAAMLHDIGIIFCNAPGIECYGTEPYIRHGICGANYLREHAAEWGMTAEEIEPYARVCERHTGSGLTLNDIKEQNLPLPEMDFLPETLEEKLICYADKFFSKTRPEEEKTIDQVLRSMNKFGTDAAARFDELHKLFG